MTIDTLAQLRTDIRQALDRARRAAPVPEGKTPLERELPRERAWAIGWLELLLEQVEIDFVPPRILRGISGPQWVGLKLPWPGRAVPPHERAPLHWDTIPCDPYYGEASELNKRYMQLEVSCHRCIDYLRISAARCPYCAQSLAAFKGRMLWKAAASDSPDLGPEWTAIGGRMRVEIEVGGEVVARATPRPGTVTGGVWTAPFSRDLVLVVRGPMRIEIEDSRVLRVLKAASVELNGLEVGTIRPAESLRDGLPLVRLGRRDKYADDQVQGAPDAQGPSRSGELT